ncbi:hypothetical protein [Myroides sp. DW712]|uniref:hypothetical protein n=1 Tax=Myroides sp. DW712 TaxID=3389800 RepID=UPI00397CDB40
MKRISFLLLGFALCSAFTVQDPLTTRVMETVKPYVAKELSIDFVNKENELTILRVDTLTEKDRLQLKGQELLSELEVDYLPFIELQRHAVNQYMLLYKIHPVNSVRIEIDNAIREYSETEAKAAPLMKQLEEVIAQEKTADAKKLVAYQVKALLKRNTDNNPSKIDTVGILVSPNFKVIQRKDFIN